MLEVIEGRVTMVEPKIEESENDVIVEEAIIEEDGYNVGMKKLCETFELLVEEPSLNMRILLSWSSLPTI